MPSSRSDSVRTRSTTRPRRDDVDRIMLPQAEMSTAGVIIAVKTAIAEAESMTRFSGFYKINPVKSCQFCPMRLWISKSSEVPIREQLVTQIVLGVVSNDLKVAERLPSTRELARRYKIHA